MEVDRNMQLFLSLVNSFQMQTMMQLGKMKNPFTDESERDLNAAQVSIDILDMLKVKTENNLSEDEKKYLEQVLSDLKLNFVAEKNKGDDNTNGTAESNTEGGESSGGTDDSDNNENNNEEKSE